MHVCLLCHSKGVLLKLVLTVMQLFTSRAEVDLFVMLMWPARAEPCMVEGSCLFSRGVTQMHLEQILLLWLV